MDLRDNPGGLVSEAVEIVNLVLFRKEESGKKTILAN